jgi:PAN domain
MQTTMHRIRRSAVAIASILALASPLLGGTPSARATVFPADGGQGDRAEIYKCPRYTVLVGFHGRSGAWIDQIGLICAEFSGPAWKRGELVHAAPKGGNGGTPQEQYCSGDSAIRAITVTNLYVPSKMTHRYARSLTFACATPRNGAGAGGARFDAPSINTGMDVTPIQGQAQICPGSEYATGLNIRYGKHVNAIGLVCDTIETRTPANDAGTTQQASSGGQLAPGMEGNTDRPGSDYDKFHINDQRPDRCQSECARQSDRCRAWTYVQPGVQHKLAVCYLKTDIPPAVASNCCVSGVQKKVVRLGRK